MTMLTWLITGSVCGLLAGLLLRSGADRKLRIDIITGIAGAILAGVLFAPSFGIEIVNQKDFSFPSMLVGFAGAIVLLAAAFFYRRYSIRPVNQ